MLFVLDTNIFVSALDRHFRKLAEVDFPKIKLLRLEDFKHWYEDL